MGCFIRPPAAQILAPAKTVIENTRGTVDAKERESHLRAWGVKKVGWAEKVGGLDGVQVSTVSPCSLKIAWLLKCTSCHAHQSTDPACSPLRPPPPFLLCSG